MTRLAQLTYLLICVVKLLFNAGVCYATSSSVEVSATILSNHNCKFDKIATAALEFGDLNPLSGLNVTAPPIEITFECKGNPNNPVSYSISDDGGLYESGSNGHQMKHDTLAAYIPYDFNVSPTSGTAKVKTTVTLTISGEVLWENYKKAYTGGYADTVFVSIDP